MKDAPIKLRMEGYVLDMAQRKRSILAVMKDVKTMCTREEYVLDMEQRELGRCKLAGCNQYVQKGGVCIRRTVQSMPNVANSKVNLTCIQATGCNIECTNNYIGLGSTLSLSYIKDDL